MKMTLDLLTTTRQIKSSVSLAANQVIPLQIVQTKTRGILRPAIGQSPPRESRITKQLLLEESSATVASSLGT